jgi:hypothetical protein
MLRTDDRLLLSEALAPPDGFSADLLVGTTYSMHLGALLSVPLAMTFADWESDDGRPTNEPIAALEAVRRHAERITVFCQAGATAASEQPPLVASWLEDCVVPVASPYGGVFHPKVWVARFRNPDGQLVYRVVCASRNLTFDRCWDDVVVVDGTPTPRGGRAPATKPLADFVAALPSMTTGAAHAGRMATVAALADELRRVRFTAPDGFDDLVFIPLGIRGHRTDPLTAVRTTRMLVVSPFVGRLRLSSLKVEDPSCVLVSRAEELATIATAQLTQFGSIYTLENLDATEGAAVEGTLSGLHAKLYVADAGWNAHVWVGSANATTAAFADNVEFLVRLDGKRSFCGIEAVLGAPDDDHALRAMLVEVPPGAEAEDPPLEAELERHLDATARAIAQRRLLANVTPTLAGALHDVELRSDEPISVPDDIAVSVWPMTGVAGALAQPVVDGSAVLGYFEQQPLGDVTAFYVLALVAERDGCQVAKQVIVKAELVGEPDGRREAILRALLSDPQQVLRLLRALLAFDATGEGGDGLSLLSELGGSAHSGTITEAPLLESLLRALAEAPERLEAVRSLLEELAALDDVLPRGLMDLWEPIRIVYEESLR